MIDASLVEQIVDAVLKEIDASGKCTPPDACVEENPFLDAFDITDEKHRKEILIEAPCDVEALARMKARTNARIGTGRAGPRYNTRTLLTLRADHAAARDAVFLDVDGEILDSLGLFSVESRCTNKNEFLTRPDLGRLLSDKSVAVIRERCSPSPDIQVFAADGLSSTAVAANLRDILPLLMDGLGGKELVLGTPFFVKNGRVGVMDHVSEILDCKVTCVLLGERPGLATAESMSAYVAYGARFGMPESERTVVSNIHRGGTPAVEAGAYLAELLIKILNAQASGIHLQSAGVSREGKDGAA
jgi:ethanolamine ammonia-lyase small subunit